MKKRRNIWKIMNKKENPQRKRKYEKNKYEENPEPK